MRKENNFDLLRFVFAFTVFLVHAQTLSQNTSLAPLAHWLSAELAIQGFFVISGYLVYMSHENSRNLSIYLQKRARRIYPAYFTVIVLSALIGALLTSKGIAEYFSADLFRYLGANLLFLNFLAPNLPGVFETNTLQAVNGALWTLKIEVMFYLSVPLIAWAARRYGHALSFAVVYAASILYSLLLYHLLEKTGQVIYGTLARQLPGQLTYFIAGMALFHYREMLPRLRWWLLPAVIVLWLVRDPVLRLALQPAALAVMVIYIAVAFRSLGNFGRYGDLSYGAYIFHFPILQAMLALGLFPAKGYLGLVVATILVIFTAFLSWHLLEKRWLQKSSHYVVANRGS